MAEYVDLVNQALQVCGTRTTVSQNELDNNTTNEAIQANLILEQYRDNLLRMAPWNCARAYMNMVWITAAAGTPENASAQTQLWQPGQPPPPWTYEYQYPVDCLKPLFIVPQFQAGFTGVPITNAVTSSAPSLWQGPPIKFQVATDNCYPVTDILISNPGTGYVQGELVTLDRSPTDEPPCGAPAQFFVLTVAPGGAISTIFIVNQIPNMNTACAGSYVRQQNGFISTTSSVAGTGATVVNIYGAQGPQRVILTNQENAVLCYVKKIENPNVWDTLFQSAYVSLLASGLAWALTGDKQLANALIEEANNDIMEARKADGNEGLTINDVTPDWIRVRGVNYPNANIWSGNQGFDWGPLWAAW